MKPFISVCIPAYKNAQYLKVLLESISVQTFKDFEVIVSDDSPGDEVDILCRSYLTVFPLQYQKNQPSKGSPANWNACIAKASGSWIKIMHADDWFAADDALEKFASAAKQNPGAGFIFSGFTNYEHNKVKDVNILGGYHEHALQKSPLLLFKKNYIGHPSTTLIKNDLPAWYDEKIKWVVDFEFYIRALKQMDFYVIKEPLINIRLHEEQVTKTAFRNREVEIPENLYLLNKLGTSVLGNIYVYDYYWRLMRNLGIRDIDSLKGYSKGMDVPAAICKMIGFQKHFPLFLLRIGVISKTVMFISFLGR